MDQQRNLPLGIVLSAIYMGIGGVLEAVGGIAFLAVPSLGIVGFAVLILAMFDLAAAYGLFRLIPWARRLTVILNAVGIIVTLVMPSLLSQQYTYLANDRMLEIITIGLSIILIVYLSTSSVRDLFDE